MKKVAIGIMILLSTAIIMSCDKNNNETIPEVSASIQTPVPTPTDTPTVSVTPIETLKPSTSPIPQESLKDYYPIRNNVKYLYEGTGNEYASYQVEADYTTENTVQEKVINGGTDSVRVIRIDEGTITKVYSQGELYYRENYLDKINENTEVLLMEPLIVGTTWTLKDGRVRTITDISYDIETPLGKYKAIEVTTESTTDTMRDYYVKDIGLVKTSYSSGDFEVTSILDTIIENTFYTQEITFYYPSKEDEKIYGTSKILKFGTNDITKKLLETSYKESFPGLESVFTKNTHISSLYLNQDGAVYIDLSGEFLTEMKEDAAYETKLLQCIANTFGQYYNAQKVLLTIDNKPYKSNNITMKKGVYLKVDILQNNN